MTRLKAALSAGLVALILATASPAHAKAPQAKVQAPGWYRMMLGNFEITALNDGSVSLPVDSCPWTSC